MNRIGRIGVVLLALLVAVAIFAPQLSPFDPHKSSPENFLPPDVQYAEQFAEDYRRTGDQELLDSFKTELAKAVKK